MKAPKKRNILLNILIAVFLIAGCVCLGVFLYYHFTYQKEAETYDDIRTTFTSEKSEQEEQPEEQEETTDLGMKEIDWESLFAANEDVVGWIVMDPGIDYPLLQGDTNDTYIHTDLYGDYAFCGSLFLNCDNSPDFTDSNTIIYGHNMQNGTMFGSLDYYYDKAYALEHSYVYIYTPEGRYTYRIARDMVVTDGSAVYSIGSFSPEYMQDYINRSAADGSVYYTVDPGIADTDRVITLSTCRYSSGPSRHVVQAVLDGFTDYDGHSYSADAVNAAMNELKGTNSGITITKDRIW